MLEYIDRNDKKMDVTIYPDGSTTSSDPRKTRSNEHPTKQMKEYHSYVCPVCKKIYISKAWFIKHLKKFGCTQYDIKRQNKIKNFI